MSKAIILGDNLFDDAILHPTHRVYHTGTPVDGSEIFNISDNLRDITRFTIAETNTTLHITMDMGVAKTFDTIIIDRGHNLKGKPIEIRSSLDNFASNNVLLSNPTIPSTPGGLPSDSNGVLTTEEVWWRRFSGATTRWARITIPALGVGQAPILTSVYLAQSYRFPEYLDTPVALDYRTKHVVLKNDMSQRGVRIKRRFINFRELDLHMELEPEDFPAMNAQVTQLLRYNHPWWFCLDDDVFTGGSDLLGLFQLPGEMTYDPVVDPIHRTVAFLMEEVAPSSYL